MLDFLRASCTDFGRDEGMWFDVRIVIAKMEMSIAELMSLRKECTDDVELMLFLPDGIGRECPLAYKVQQRALQETGEPNQTRFAVVRNPQDDKGRPSGQSMAEYSARAGSASNGRALRL